jgi:hypothetical protein
MSESGFYVNEADYIDYIDRDYITGTLTSWVKAERRLEILVGVVGYLLRMMLVMAAVYVAENFLNLDYPMWQILFLWTVVFIWTFGCKQAYQSKQCKAAIQNGRYDFRPVSIERYDDLGETNQFPTETIKLKRCPTYASLLYTDGYAVFRPNGTRIVTENNPRATFHGYGPVCNTDGTCLFVRVYSKEDEIIQTRLIPLYTESERFCKKNKARGKIVREKRKC